MTTLHAGPVSAVYEAGGLRYLRVGRQEVLRRVMVAVRDRHWGTVPPIVTGGSVVAQERNFEIRFEAAHVSDEVDFAWRGRITGNADGSIRFEMQGAPRRRFQRNRIGICVLHPIAECAGSPCVIVHGDGTRERTIFPGSISPHQPFFDVRSIAHYVREDVSAAVSFSGDYFETEDQRNWTDASFKTYSTPLSLPYPVEVGPEDVVEQSIELSISGPAERWALESAEPRNLIRVKADCRATMPRLSVYPAERATPFAELNRNRSRAGFWGIDARVHADDGWTIVENLAGQAPTVRTALRFLGDVPIEIAPVLVPPVRAANGWVAISVRELALAGAATVTYSADVAVLRELREFQPDSVIGCESDAPLLYDAAIFKSGENVRAWVANFSRVAKTIRVGDASADVPPFGVRTVAL